jgi:LytS/YehU family sensor histidine kinase
MHNVLLSLSKIYRYVLEQKTRVGFIEEELAFAKTYMNLLKMRFEDREYELKVESRSRSQSSAIAAAFIRKCSQTQCDSAQKPLQIRIYIESGF